jgi:hypothetical protein
VQRGRHVRFVPGRDSCTAQILGRKQRHIHGTDVPVEEPFTTSKPEIGLRQCHTARSTGSFDSTKTIGIERVPLCTASRNGVPLVTITSGVDPDQLRGVGRLAGTAGPAILDLNIAAVHPTKLSKTLPKCGDARLPFGFVFFGPHQHANPPHVLGLLRTRGERKTRRRPAKSRDKLTSSH